MGAVVKAIGSLLGVGGGAKAPTTNTAPANATVDDAAAAAKKARTALLETAGGSAGSPLQPGEVGGTSNTLFGN